MRGQFERRSSRLGWTTAAAALLVASAALLATLYVNAAPGSAATASSCRWRKAGPPGLTTAVAVTSVAARAPADVWLVGFTYRSSLDDAMGSWHWNSRRWLGAGVKGLTARVTPVLSVASSGRDAWAVGRLGSRGPLALHWNSRFRDRFGYTWWARVGVPRTLAPGGLDSVVMVSPRDLWAVGDTFVLHRLKTWSRITPPAFVVAGTSLSVTTVPGTTAVWITGYDEDADVWHAARWTGSGWADSTVTPGLIHNRPGRNIAFATATDGWIVGRAPTRKGQALVVHWNGLSWSPVNGLPLPPASASELSGVAVRSPNDVWTVGSYLTSSGATRSLVLHWDGAKWSRMAAPGPGLTEVAVVPGSRQAWAVGGSYLGKRLVLDNVLRYRC